MPKHRNDAYQDDAHKWVVFCKVCGQEGVGFNPEGECSGVFEPKPLKSDHGRGPSTEVVGKSPTLKEFSENYIKDQK